MTRPTVTELAAHPFLEDFPDHRVETLVEIARRVVLGEGERIFEEEEPADRLWLLWMGKIDLDIRLPAGTLAIGTLGYGDVLGWSSVFPPYQWGFGAVAANDTEAIELDAGALRALSRQDAVFGREIYHRLGAMAISRLQSIRDRLLDLYEISR